MNRSRVTGDLASHGNIFVDIANDRVGIGSTIPTNKLDIRGIVESRSAIHFHEGNWTGETTKIQLQAGYLHIEGGSNGTVFRRVSGGNCWYVTSAGHFTVSTDSTFDIGTNAARVRNIYADTLYGDGANLTNTGSSLSEPSSGTQRLVTTSLTSGTMTSSGTGSELAFDYANNHLEFLDSVKATFGTGGDLELYHDGSHSYIHDGGTGNLKVRSNNFRVSNADESKLSATFVPSGAVELYHNNTKRLETLSTGAAVTGELDVSGTIDMNTDTGRLKLGAGDDLSLWHDGSNSYIANTSGQLRIWAKTDGYAITCTADGSVDLYHNNSVRLATTSGGIDVTGTVTADNQIVLNSGDSTPARIDLYCEVSNAHYTRLQAPAHSTYSGNVTATLPNVTGNLAVLANAADNRVVTATGTHGMTGESNLTFNGSTLAVTGAITASTSITATNNLITNGNFTISTTNPNIFLTDTDNDSDYRISNSNGVLEFRDVTNTATRLSIDSSGNVLVGTTDSTIYNNGDGQSEGIVLRGGEVIDIARAGDLQLTLNRQTNDGPHIGFYRSGVAKSFISTRDSAFCIDVNSTNERLRIKSDGSTFLQTDNVNINRGTSGAGYPLTVRGPSSGDVLRLERANSGQWHFGFDGNTVFIIKQNTTEVLRIGTDGDVTMTATGDPTLKVIGPGQAQLTLTSTSGTDHCSINFGDSSDHDAGEIRYTNSSDSLNFDTAGAARMILDSSGNLYPNNDGDQSLGQSSNRWRNLFLRQGGQIQIGDATSSNWFGITEGLANTYTDQDFMSIYYRGSMRFFSSNNNERVRIHSDGDLQLYNGNLVGNSSNTMEIGDYTNGSVKRVRMCQGGEIHFGDTTSSNFMGITEGTVNQFSDVDNIGIYYRNALKFFSNSNTERASFDSTGNLRLANSEAQFSTTHYACNPTVSSNYTVTTTYNEMMIGPITINNGVTLTVNTGARLVIL